MNKILLIAALAVIMSGTMANVPQAEALCTIDNPNCCPPQLAPVCATMQDPKDFLVNGCPVCQTEFQSRLYDFAMVNEFRNIEIEQKLYDLEISIAKGDPSPQPSVSGVVITDGLIIGLVGISIVLGLVNIFRKR